jgi:hypothetical protein
MPDIDKIHNEAMDLAEEAFCAKRQGDIEQAKVLFLKALELEKKAFYFFPVEEDSEPTRSILIRSAASMAFHAREYDQAEQIVNIGLCGFPPAEIKSELKSLQDDINFRQHIVQNKLELADNEMLMTLWGNATGFGIISIDLLVKRIDQLKTIFYRTIERLSNVPYRSSGGPSKTVRKSYKLYLNDFIPGSFGVSFSIGERSEQLSLFPEDDKEKIGIEDAVNEVLTCFDLLQKNEIDDLKERFADVDYFENFISVSRQMAPDGNEIKGIGLTLKSKGKQKTVGLSRIRKEIPTPDKISTEHYDDIEPERERVVLNGILKHADSLKIENKYGVVKLYNEEEKKPYSILVPLTQMQDVVQPYFEEKVIIISNRIGNKFYFDDIESADE